MKTVNKTGSPIFVLLCSFCFSKALSRFPLHLHAKILPLKLKRQSQKNSDDDDDDDDDDLVYYVPYLRQIETMER